MLYTLLYSASKHEARVVNLLDPQTREDLRTGFYRPLEFCVPVKQEDPAVLWAWLAEHHPELHP